MRRLEENDTTIYDEDAPRLYFRDLRSGKFGTIPRDAIDEILQSYSAEKGWRILFKTHGISEWEIPIYRGSRQCTAMEYNKMLDWFESRYWDRRAQKDYYTPEYMAAVRRQTLKQTA